MNFDAVHDRGQPSFACGRIALLQALAHQLAELGDGLFCDLGFGPNVSSRPHKRYSRPVSVRLQRANPFPQQVIHFGDAIVDQFVEPFQPFLSGRGFALQGSQLSIDGRGSFDKACGQIG